jgi:hypothetical protein
MGIFDIFFRKKERTFGKANLENLEEAAKKKISEHEQGFKNSSAIFFSQVKEQENKIKESLERLSSAQAPAQVDLQLLKIAITSRKSFAKKVEDLIKEKEQTDSFSSLYEMYNSFSLEFEAVDASTVSEFAAIKEVFKNESYAVIGEMKTLKKIYVDFKEKLKKEMSAVQPYEEIETKIKVLKEEKERLENYKKDLESILQKNENLKKENEMLQINLRKIEESEEWKEYLETKKKLEQKENERREIISQVVQKFSSVERPLKKLNNILQKTESEINRKLLEKYFSSTFDAFVEDYEKKTINSALKEAAKYIEENKIDEKKSLGKINEMVSSDSFNQLAREWQKTNDEIAELNERTENSEVAKKKEEIAKIISNREGEIRQNRKEKLEQQTSILEQDFATHKDELQQLAKDNMSMEVDL